VARLQIPQGPHAELFDGRHNFDARSREFIADRYRWPFRDISAHKPGLDELGQAFRENGVADAADGLPKPHKRRAAPTKDTENHSVPSHSQHREGKSDRGITLTRIGFQVGHDINHNRATVFPVTLFSLVNNY